MPKLKDAKVIWRNTGVVRFGRLIYSEIAKDDLFTLAAAMAYAWLFSIFPFIIILLTLLPYVPEKYRNDAQAHITSSSQAFGKEAADVITTNIDLLLKTKRGGLMSMGIILTLWASSGGMAATMSAMDKCCSAQTRRPYWFQRPFAILLTVVVATLILAVLILLPISTTVIHVVIERPGFINWLNGYPLLRYLFKPILIALDLVRWVIALFMMFTVLGVIYRFGPNIKQRFRFFSPGAVFSVVVWIVLGIGFRFYIDKFGKYDKTYGTLGGAVILLLFFYIDSLVLLVGAEINSELDRLVLERDEPRLPLDPAPSEPPTAPAT
jgi:membrane protein